MHGAPNLSMRNSLKEQADADAAAREASMKETDLPEEPTIVAVSIDVCRRLVLSPDDQSLLRVVNTATGRVPEIEELRGHLLLEVRSGTTSTPISSQNGNTLQHLLDLLDMTGASAELEDDALELVFHKPSPMHRANKEEESRARRNLLRPEGPTDPVTELSEHTLLLNLQSRSGGLLGNGRPRLIRDVAQMPSSSCLYFDHPHWRLNGLGALESLPPSKLRELDLKDNFVSQIGDSLSRFELLTDLRLAGNGLAEIALHYLPRLKHLDLHNNRLQLIPEIAGLPSLGFLDLCDNEIGGADAPKENDLSGADEQGLGGGVAEGWRSIARAELAELKVLWLANNRLTWSQKAFNARISALREKKALRSLDFRGNPMLFSPRLDDLAPLQKYREWITQQVKPHAARRTT